MKKYLLLFLVFGLVFSSCDKDSFFDKTPEFNQNSSQSVTNRSNPDLTDIVYQNEMLYFQSKEHFYSTIALLEKKLEEHLSNLDSDFSELSEDEIGFDNWKPLTEFENKFPGFESRRKLIENQILSWLNNEELNMDNDPDDLDSYDEEFRTVLNQRGVVNIAGEEVNFLDLESELESRSLDCRHFKKSKRYKEYDNGKRRIKVKVAFRSWPWRTITKGKVVNYKKKRRWGKWRWRRSRAWLQIQVGGHVRDTGCKTPRKMGASKGPKKRSALKAKWTFWGLPMHKAVLGSQTNGEIWTSGFVVGETGLLVFLH